MGRVPERVVGTRVWLVGLAMSAAWMGLYGVLTARLWTYTLQPQSAHADTASSSIGSLSALSMSASTDVPDSVVKAIAEDTGVVPGLEDLVVLGSATGTGYVVSATVDLGYGSSPPSNWQSQVERDVMAYFQGVYGSGKPVSSAELYFLQDGQIIAGAGLGVDVYHKLSPAAFSTGQGFVQDLKSQPMVAGDSPDDSWFEEASAASLSS